MIPMDGGIASRAASSSGASQEQVKRAPERKFLALWPRGPCANRRQLAHGPVSYFTAMTVTVSVSVAKCHLAFFVAVAGFPPEAGTVGPSSSHQTW